MENTILVTGVLFISVFFTTFAFSNAFFALICLQPVFLLLGVILSQYAIATGIVFYGMIFIFLAVLNVLALWFCGQINTIKIKQSTEKNRENDTAMLILRKKTSTIGDTSDSLGDTSDSCAIKKRVFIEGNRG